MWMLFYWLGLYRNRENKVIILWNLYGKNNPNNFYKV